MKDVLLIYNPAAGRFPVKPFIQSIVRTLSANNLRIHVAETLNGRHSTQLARQAGLENYYAAFAIGGDGTVGQVANGLLGSDTALGVLPAGTSNVWARELGLPTFTWLRWNSLRENADLLSKSPVVEIDVGLCNQQSFLMWTGIGLDAMAVNKLEPRKRFYKYISIPHYMATTIYNASFWHGMNLDVWADDQKVDGHYLLAIVSNIRHYMGGLSEISPQALIDDGKMELWLLSGSNLADTFRHFFELVSGRHITSNYAHCIIFQKLRIESETPFSIQMDGEPMLAGNQVEISVLHRGLRVLLPPQAHIFLSQSSLSTPYFSPI
ncbi:MAG: YegS/Rv2252/BmrU family lipid kinase [Chloroflexota bacterium]